MAYNPVELMDAQSMMADLRRLLEAGWRATAERREGGVVESVEGVDVYSGRAVKSPRGVKEITFVFTVREPL